LNNKNDALLPRLRLEQLLGRIAEVSDLDYQRRVWSGAEPNIWSSFSELINTIFSDLDAENLCRTDAKSLGIGEADCRELSAFLTKLDLFASRLPPYADVGIVQSYPEWLDLSKNADILAEHLQRYAPTFDRRNYLEGK
jgi:hypothetical protein